MVYLCWVFGEMGILYWVYGIFSIGLIYVNVGFVGKICKFFESKNAITTLISFIFIFFYAYLRICWCQNSSSGLFFIALDWFNVVEWWILFLKLRVNFNLFIYFFNSKTWESMWLELIYSSFWILQIALINLARRSLKNKLYSLSYISDDTSSGREKQLGVFVFLKFFGLFYSEYLVKLEFMYWTFFKFFWLAWYIWLWGL